MKFRTRPLMPWDAPSLFKLTGCPDATRYLGFETHKTVTQAELLINTYSRSPGQWFAIYAVGAAQDVLGVAGVEFHGHSATMAVYTSVHDVRARGAARAFVVPMARELLSLPAIWRIWAHCHVDNIAVQNVLERSGIRREGRMRRYAFFPNISNEPQDCYLYAETA